MPGELFTNAGIKWICDVLLQQIAVDDFQVVLLTDTVPFALTDDPTDHTPNVLTGGSPFTLGSSDWTTAVSAGVASGTSTVMSWNFAPYAGGTTIEQYMVLDASTGLVLIWGGALPTPYAVPSGGGLLNLVINFPMELCTP